MKIALIGEAWGEHEARAQMPFVGASGYQLNSLLEDAGIERAECFITTVFNLKPEPTNDIKNLCVSKTDLGASNLSPIAPGKFLHAKYVEEVLRVRRELADYKPNVAVCLGGAALWAFTGISSISKYRGTLINSQYPEGIKLLPTFNPSYVLKVASARPIVVMDLLKAKRQSEFPEIRRPRRTLILEPTLADLQSFYEQARTARCMSVDIETAAGRITCIGFAIRADYGIVVPFWDGRNNGNFWSTNCDEVAAWRIIRKLLALDTPKLFQNGLYDVHWLWKKYRIPVNNFDHDTMLLHHALQPEFEKGLGFLGSIYTDEPAWKLNKPRGQKKAQKKED